MYNEGFTPLKHKNYVEGKKKVWLPWSKIDIDCNAENYK